MEYIPITTFDYWAKQQCPLLFRGNHESYSSYLKRTGRKNEYVRYLSTQKKYQDANEPTFRLFAYATGEPWSCEMVTAMLDRCPSAHKVYSCSRRKESLVYHRICYYWETDKGLFVILPECQNTGKVENILVRVYRDLETMASDIFELWSTVSSIGFDYGYMIPENELSQNL